MQQMDAIYRDVHYACRLLARRPGFTVVAVLTLAVGLGTMTVAFSAVNALFIATPFIEAPGAGLVMVTDDAPESGGVSFREFEAFARDVPALDIAAQSIVTLSHRHSNTVDIVWGLAVTDNYFDVLDTTAAIGRTFVAEDELSVIVTDRFWRERLSSASLGGLTARLNGLDVPVAGVLPQDFRAGLYDPDVWVRIADWDALQLPARSRRPEALTLTVFGRLRAGATDAQADAQLRSVARELSRAWPATNARRTASFVPLDGGLPGLPETRALAVVATMAMGMIGIVLLIALFNVVGLLLSRAVDREREMSVRGALGASRGRLTQQLITESLVIATIAGLVALLVTRWSNDLLGLFAVEAPIPQRLDVTPDSTVALFTGMLMIICGIAAGVWPARRATSRALVAAMAPSTVIGGGRAGTLRSVIVSIQIAGATVLVTLAALLVRNALLTAAVDVGFESERAVVLEFDPASFGYREAATERFVADAVVRLAALPGVVSASVMDRAPFYVGFPTRLDVSVDGQPCAIGECPTAASYHVGPDYFRTMNIRLRSGRELRGVPEDTRSVVISESMARRFWPSENPLGQRFRLGPDGYQVQVVGVAADVIHRAVGERPEPYVYVPFDQAALAQPLTIVLRTVMTAEPLLNVVAAQVRAMDPSLPIYRVRTMAQRLSERQQAGGLIVARFFGICGGLALFLAIVGLSGTIAYAAGQRHREFGIRAAVGASPSDLARLVLGSALRMAGPGIVAGLFAALLVSWLMAARLSGLDLDSPATFAWVGLVQLTVAVAAAGVPGLRASRTNALATLRAE